MLRLIVPDSAPMKSICVETAPVSSNRPPSPSTAASMRMKPVSVIGPIWSSAWMTATTYTSPSGSPAGSNWPSSPGADLKMSNRAGNPAATNGANDSGTTNDWSSNVVLNITTMLPLALNSEPTFGRPRPADWATFK